MCLSVSPNARCTVKLMGRFSFFNKDVKLQDADGGTFTVFNSHMNCL